MSMSRMQTRPEQAELEGLQVWSVVRGPSSWGERTWPAHNRDGCADRQVLAEAGKMSHYPKTNLQ